MQIYLFFLLGISLCNAASSPESFEQKMSRARYSDVLLFERVGMYQDLLKSISHGFACEAETHEFVASVLGMLRQRPVTDVVVLRALKDLVKSITSSRVIVLQGYAKEFSQWKDILDADLSRFALADGDVVKIRVAHAPGCCLSVLSGEEEPRADLVDSEGLAGFFKIVLRKGAGDSKTQRIVAGGEKMDVVPMYWERSGVACALGNDYVTQFTGDVLARTPTVVIQKNTKKGALPLNVMKREKAPAYTGESLHVAHPGCGEWATILERVPPDSLSRLENDNLHQALERIGSMPGALDKIKWLNTLRFNFNERIVEKNSAALFRQLSTLMGQRGQFDYQTLLAARQLIISYESLNLLKSQDRYLAEWLRSINKLLEPHAVKFGDVIKISSMHAQDGVLCVAPYVKGGSSGFSKEIRLGIGPVHGSGHGHSLITLISPVGKQGPIALGDEVELVLPHVDGSRELRCVLIPSDGQSVGRVLALNIEDIGANADTVFVVDGVLKPGFLGENRGAPLVSGDSFYFRSKKTQKILGARKQQAAFLWAMVEPFDEASSLLTDAVVQFSIDLMPVEAVTNVVTKSFYDKLGVIKREPSLYLKIAHLMLLLDSFSPNIFVEDRSDFWDVVTLILADKKRMNEHELNKVVELMNKVALVAKTHNVQQWLVRAKQALVDLEFYKKVRRATATPGMDRFKALLELAPEVKNISLSESQDFIGTLKTLRKYKKDQSRAAKLLLSEVAEEASFDSASTGTGNLLVK